MEAVDLKRFVKGINSLSTIPLLMEKILSLVKKEDSSARELYKLISHDYALAEKVVRVANSTFFGHSGEVKDIRQAIMFLGYDRIKSIALGMSIMHLLPADGSFNMKNLWSHSYEVALFSEALSEIICMTCPRECFLSGLLHDIGRIIFCKMNYKRFLDIGSSDKLLEREKEVFGCTHADAGAWFALENGLPPEIVSVIQSHHKPSSAKDYKDTVSIVSLAEALSRRYNPTIENDGIWTEEHDIILLEFSLTDENILSASKKFCAEKPAIEEFFELS
ncbi:MAG: HDOD domain-containing protein [Nitrospirota bacterium]